MNVRLNTGTSLEGKPEHYSCIQYLCAKSSSGVWLGESTRSAGPERVQGLQSTLCSSLDAPHSPCISSSQLPDPGHLPQLYCLQNCDGNSKVTLWFTSVVICIEVLVIIRSSLTQSQHEPKVLIDSVRWWLKQTTFSLIRQQLAKD